MNPVYEDAKKYAIEVLKAVKDSGYEMDYPLEQFVNDSILIGAVIAKAEPPMEQREILKAYKDALGYSYRASYWSELLGELADYERIPFSDLRKQCDNVSTMLNFSINLMVKLIGKG